MGEIMRAALILLLLGITGQASAQAKDDNVMIYVDGLALKRHCETDQGFCYGYISAITDTILVLGAMDRGPKICLPQSVKLEQVKLVVTKYLADNPDKLHIVAHTLASRAVVDAFPCKP
jgi:hypothetical protein